MMRLHKHKDDVFLTTDVNTDALQMMFKLLQRAVGMNTWQQGVTIFFQW